MEKMFVTILMNVESDLTIAKDEMEFVLTKKVLSHVHVILDTLVTVIIALIMMNARWVIISVQDRVFKLKTVPETMLLGQVNFRHDST